MNDATLFMITGALILTFGILLGYLMHHFSSSGTDDRGTDLFDAYRTLETAEQRAQLLSIVHNYCLSTPDLQTALYENSNNYRELAESRNQLQQFNLNIGP